MGRGQVRLLERSVSQFEIRDSRQNQAMVRWMQEGARDKQRTVFESRNEIPACLPLERGRQWSEQSKRLKLIGAGTNAVVVGARLLQAAITATMLLRVSFLLACSSLDHFLLAGSQELMIRMLSSSTDDDAKGGGAPITDQMCHTLN